jgi:hypothetical protein
MNNSFSHSLSKPINLPLNLLEVSMKWIFRKDPMRRLQRDSDFPLGAFFCLSSDVRDLSKKGGRK